MTDEEVQEIRERLLPVAKAWFMGAEIEISHGTTRSWSLHTEYREINNDLLDDYYLYMVLRDKLTKPYALELAEIGYVFRIAGDGTEYRAAA